MRESAKEIEAGTVRAAAPASPANQYPRCDDRRNARARDQATIVGARRRARVHGKAPGRQGACAHRAQRARRTHRRHPAQLVAESQKPRDVQAKLSLRITSRGIELLNRTCLNGAKLPMA